MPLEHPQYSWFARLGLRWYAVPLIADLAFDVGGITYTAAPFNGWYMATEIGARNFTDEDRYDMLPVVAKKMGLDTRQERSLWRDHAYVVINQAVLYSFDKRSVKIVDHHATSRDFLEFAQTEMDLGRYPFTNWSWVVPPISGAVSPLFHVHWHDETFKPMYDFQEKAWNLPRPPQPSQHAAPDTSDHSPLAKKDRRPGHPSASVE